MTLTARTADGKLKNLSSVSVLWVSSYVPGFRDLDTSLLLKRCSNERVIWLGSPDLDWEPGRKIFPYEHLGSRSVPRGEYFSNYVCHRLSRWRSTASDSVANEHIFSSSKSKRFLWHDLWMTINLKWNTETSVFDADKQIWHQELRVEMTKLYADDVFIFVLFLKCRVKTSLQDLSAFSRFSQRAEISPMNPKKFRLGKRASRSTGLM